MLNCTFVSSLLAALCRYYWCTTRAGSTERSSRRPQRATRSSVTCRSAAPCPNNFPNPKFRVAASLWHAILLLLLLFIFALHCRRGSRFRSAHTIRKWREHLSTLLSWAAYFVLLFSDRSRTSILYSYDYEYRALVLRVGKWCCCATRTAFELWSTQPTWFRATGSRRRRGSLLSSLLSSLFFFSYLNYLLLVSYSRCLIWQHLILQHLDESDSADSRWWRFGASSWRQPHRLQARSPAISRRLSVATTRTLDWTRSISRLFADQVLNFDNPSPAIYKHTKIFHIF